MRRLQDVMNSDEIMQRGLEFARKHGMNTALPPAPVTCAICGGRGVFQLAVAPDHPDFGKLFPCEQCPAGQDLLTRRWQNGLKTAGLPINYQSLTFQTWEAISKKQREGKRLAEAVAKLFVAHPDGWVSLAQAYEFGERTYSGADVVRNWIILQGLPGLGKTGLAAAIVNHRAYNKLPTLYLRLQSFLVELTDRYNDNWQPRTANDPKTPGEVLELVTHVPVLVLDEINLQSATDHSQRVFEQIVRDRAGAARPTVFTCNFTADELKAQWNERAVDMLLATAHWIPMGGQRLRAKAEPAVLEAF